MFCRWRALLPGWRGLVRVLCTFGQSSEGFCRCSADVVDGPAARRNRFGSQLVIFEIGASGFFDGVSLVVSVQLGGDEVSEMEIHLFGEFEEENGYVGHLITDFFLPLLCTGMDLIGGLPNEVLQ